MKPAWVLVAAFVLSGCAATDWTKGPSYVGPLDAGDNSVVVKAVADFVRLRMPLPGGIFLQKAENDAAVGPDLAAQLDKDGYTQTQDTPHRVSYAVQPYDDNILVMAVVDDSVGTRLFSRDPSTHLLRPQGPLTIREPSIP